MSRYLSDLLDSDGASSWIPGNCWNASGLLAGRRQATFCTGPGAEWTSAGSSSGAGLSAYGEATNSEQAL